MKFVNEIKRAVLFLCALWSVVSFTCFVVTVVDKEYCKIDFKNGVQCKDQFVDLVMTANYFMSIGLTLPISFFSQPTYLDMNGIVLIFGGFFAAFLLVLPHFLVLWVITTYLFKKAFPEVYREY